MDSAMLVGFRRCLNAGQMLRAVRLRTLRSYSRNAFLPHRNNLVTRRAHLCVKQAAETS